MATIGADPEFLLIDKTTKLPKAVCGLIGGVKGAPIDLSNEYRVDAGWGLHEDGVALELNLPPVNDAGLFYNNILNALELIRRRLKPMGLTLSSKSEAVYPEKELESQQARVFGCDPDRDAYNEGNLRTMEPESFGSWRFAGGHIHLGTTTGFNCPPWVAALFADYFIGLPLVSMVNPSYTVERRKWYGQPGIFREKPYGIEYRTPCNRWLFSVDNVYYIIDRAVRCARWMETTPANELMFAMENLNWGRIKHVIQHHEQQNARTLQQEGQTFIRIR